MTDLDAAFAELKDEGRHFRIIGVVGHVETGVGPKDWATAGAAKDVEVTMYPAGDDKALDVWDRWEPIAVFCRKSDGERLMTIPLRKLQAMVTVMGSPGYNRPAPGDRDDEVPTCPV